MYPKGSPKYNLLQSSSMGKKKSSPKITKKGSPKGEKPRAQWNPILEKALVEILHEHNNPYPRGQNGWNGETWNMMVNIFHTRHKHVNLTKTQIQDKEKELKRDYKMLKEAHKQSGVGWNENRCMLVAEAHLWDNLVTSFCARIKKFKTKSFPLFHLLGELYDGHTAEGKLNFTSISKPLKEVNVTEIESDGEFQAEKEMEKEVAKSEDDLQILNQAEVEHEQVNQRSVTGDGAQRRAEVEHGRVNQKKVVGGSRKKSKNSPKKSSADGLVGVMQRFVDIKEKESKKEDSHDFSITRCMAVLRTLEGVTTTEKILASDVFKSVDNREFFMSVADEEDGTALLWFRSQMAKLT